MKKIIMVLALVGILFTAVGVTASVPEYKQESVSVLDTLSSTTSVITISARGGP